MELSIALGIQLLSRALLCTSEKKLREECERRSLNKVRDLMRLPKRTAAGTSDVEVIHNNVSKEAPSLVFYFRLGV